MSEDESSDVPEWSFLTGLSVLGLLSLYALLATDSTGAIVDPDFGRNVALIIWSGISAIGWIPELLNDEYSMSFIGMVLFLPVTILFAGVILVMQLGEKIFELSYNSTTGTEEGGTPE